MNQLQQKASQTSNNIATGLSAGIGAAMGMVGVQIATMLGSAIGGAMKAVPLAGDAMVSALAKIEGSIEQTAISGQEAVAIYEKLHQIGMNTGISANDSAAAFSRLQIAIMDMGRPVSDTIDLLEGIQAAGLVSGATTQDVSEAVRQLGQALGKGKLNGDELVSLMERMPKMMHAVRKELGMTTAEFFEASEKGKLTPEALVPALLSAGRVSIEEFARAPTTMASGFQILTISAQRFAAELDKQLKISQTLARIFVYIAHRLNAWREYISMIGDLIDQLGGFEGIVRAVGAALIVAFGPTMLASVGAVGAAFMALSRSILAAFLPLASFAMWFVIVEDFITWMRGGRSLFGEKFGDFNTVVENIKGQFGVLKEWFLGFGIDIDGMWERLVASTIEDFNAIKGELAAIGPYITAIKEWLVDFVAYLPTVWTDFYDTFANIVAFLKSIPQQFSDAWMAVRAVTDPFVEKIKSIPSAIMDAFRLLDGFFVNLFALLMRPVNAFFDSVSEKLAYFKNLIRDTFSFGASAATPAPPGSSEPVGENADPRRRMIPNFLSHQPPDMSGRLGGTNNNVNAPVTADIDINITAPGADPASIGAAAQRGVTAGMTQSGTRLGDTLARGLGVTMPRVESPVMP